MYSKVCRCTGAASKSPLEAQFESSVFPNRFVCLVHVCSLHNLHAESVIRFAAWLFARDPWFRPHETSSCAIDADTSLLSRRGHASSTFEKVHEHFFNPFVDLEH